LAQPQSKLLLTQGLFTELNNIKTVQDAERLGYKPVGAPGALPECVPDMGMHYSKNPLNMVDGKNFPELPMLMFNNKGQLIGFELESLTPQQVPPWEHLQQGHPGMEFEHWTLHIYIIDPHGACGS